MPLKLLGVRTLHSGYLKVLEARLQPEHGEAFAREVEHHGDAVAVLPYDPERRCALLVRLPRAPVIWTGGPDTLLEALAGMVEEGEAAEACARREADEEAGLRLRSMEPVARAWSSPGVSSERISLFLAPYSAADREGEGGGLAEEHEHIQALETPLAALWADVEAGRIDDLKTLALILALKARRPELFGPPPAR